MIVYDKEKNAGDFNFMSKQHAILELIVISNSVLQILDIDNVKENELKEIYVNVCKKYGITLDCRLFHIANMLEVEAMDRLLADMKGGIE